MRLIRRLIRWSLWRTWVSSPVYPLFLAGAKCTLLCDVLGPTPGQKPSAWDPQGKYYSSALLWGFGPSDDDPTGGSLAPSWPYGHDDGETVLASVAKGSVCGSVWLCLISAWYIPPDGGINVSTTCCFATAPLLNLLLSNM